MVKNSIHFNNLNGLRFLGAFMVFIFHSFTLQREIWGEFSTASWFQVLSKIAAHAHHGVLLFFVLSGFLITYLLLLEIDKFSKIHLFQFLARRSLRIWPLYFLICAFGFLIFPHLPWGIQTVHSARNYLLFFSNFDEIWIGWKDKINFLTATWSVSVEEQFYLFWGIVISLFPFKNYRWFLFFFFSVIAGSLLFRTFHYTEHRVLYYHTFAVMSDVAIGGILAVLYHSGKAQLFIKNWTKSQILLVYILGGIALVGQQYVFQGILIVFERLILALFAAFIVLEQIESNHSFWKADNVPFFEKWGKLTYGFYLFHCIYIYYLAHVFVHFHWIHSVFHFCCFLVLVFLTSLITATLSFRYVESPILSLKRYFRS
jgi:peptidoglycan/LPS O-acetylase OafA/YrhL